MGKSAYDNIIFLLVAHAIWITEPTLVFAQEGNYHPQNFTQPVNVSRGTIVPAGQGDTGSYLTHDETCRVVQEIFGWDPDTCSTIEFALIATSPAIDSIIIDKPVSDGYVNLDDWQAANAPEEIDDITKSYTSSVKAQSEKLGVPIEFTGWRLYPTVDKRRNILYYAGSLMWDGVPQINISMSLFDRQGFVKMVVVPTNAALSNAEIASVVASVAALYKPNLGSSYAEFTSGDKVAAYGALGVFASLLGVKYGKAATAGFVAVAMLILKKAWFLLFLPFLLIGKLFRGKRDGV